MPLWFYSSPGMLEDVWRRDSSDAAADRELGGSALPISLKTSPYLCLNCVTVMRSSAANVRSQFIAFMVNLLVSGFSGSVNRRGQ